MTGHDQKENMGHQEAMGHQENMEVGRIFFWTQKRW